VLSSDGRRHIVDFILPNDPFGLAAAGLRRFCVEALVPGTLIARFPRGAAERLADSDPEVGGYIREAAFTSIVHLQQRMVILGRTSALEKVSAFLLEIADRGQSSPIHAVLLPMSRYDIADYLAIAVETVSRALTQLRQRGAIVLDSSRVVRIIDRGALQAQIRQVQGLLEGAKAQLEQAERDVSRYTELIAKNATTQVTLNNARTQVTLWRASVDSNTGQLENLNIQLSYCTIRAPISGRVSMAAVKVGNFVRQADLTPLATIIQTAPVYVTFSVSQGYLPDLRQALVNESATIEAVIPGDTRRANGQVTMIENSVDAPTGMVPVRATMPNDDELLWPGTLVTVRLTFREEEAVTVPSTAVQVSQSGTYVFVVDDGVAKVQPVTVARVSESDSVIASGLAGGETVVTNGQLQLSNGTKVAPRGPKVGS